MIRRKIRRAVWLTGIVLAACSILALSEGKKETDKNPREVHQEEFIVVGIAVRTSNAKEITSEGAIGKQWERLMREGLLATIPNKVDGSIMALYTDYASDKDGEYTFVLGARVTKAENIPAGMVAKKVPGGRYAVFTSQKGPVEKVVVETWQRVWATPKNALGGERTYKADFEIYDQRAHNPANAVVDLYVAVR
jgi:predicted transcriptional regulator YdeE